MEIDEDMQFFFKICNLEWRNFSFEELVAGYKNKLFLIVDKDSKHHMNIDLLDFFVSTFSRILETFFKASHYDKEIIYAYSTDRAAEVWKKANSCLGEKYTNNEMVIGLSLMIMHEFIETHNLEYGFEKEMLTFNKMVENFCYIEKICESVDKKVEDIQKGIVFKSS